VDISVERHTSATASRETGHHTAEKIGRLRVLVDAIIPPIKHGGASQTLLKLLRLCWKIQRPQDYLFPGSQSGTHVQAGTIQEICRDACRMAGIEKRVTPHTLRHYAASRTMPQVLNRSGSTARKIHC
jgi:hypothetical protein